MICFLLAPAMLALLGLASAHGQAFTFEPVGALEPGSGQGLADTTVWFPGLRFPIEAQPAFLNSQVHRPGGSMASAPGGQCAYVNYSYPWRDSYCETRSWSMPLCPAGKGHQGIDIRPATCQKDTHWAVAAEAGVISQIGSFSVSLQAATGTVFRYLHLNMDQLAVAEGQSVQRGQRIGMVSNHFGGTPTTIHLHLDVKDSFKLPNGTIAIVFGPSYASLVEAYKRLLSGNP